MCTTSHTPPSVAHLGLRRPWCRHQSPLPPRPTLLPGPLPGKLPPPLSRGLAAGASPSCQCNISKSLENKPRAAFLVFLVDACPRHSSLRTRQKKKTGITEFSSSHSEQGHQSTAFRLVQRRPAWGGGSGESDEDESSTSADREFGPGRAVGRWRKYSADRKGVRCGGG